MRAEFLFTVAEIAIALAGFAGLIVAISRRHDRLAEEVRLEIELLKNVLGASFLVVAFSLIPAVLLGMEVDSVVAWRSSAFLFFISFTVYISLTIPKTVASYRATNRTIPRTYLMNIGLAVVVIIDLALVVIGVLPVSAYLPALLYVLYAAGVSFVRVFLSVMRDEAA